MKSLLAITLTLSAGFCPNEKVVTYFLSPNSKGFCVIFIKDNMKMNDLSKINIEGGLAKMNKQLLRHSFVIKHLHSDTAISIVEIGEEDSIADNKTYVFRLLKGSTGSLCQKEQIKLVSFFVGKKSEYVEWDEKCKSTVDCLDALNPDWCNYYKTD